MILSIKLGKDIYFKFIRLQRACFSSCLCLKTDMIFFELQQLAFVKQLSPISLRRPRLTASFSYIELT